MFGIFGKNQKFTKQEFVFFKDVVSKLPQEYDFLKSQITDEFILGKKPNSLGEKGSYILLLNAKLESKYRNKALPNFFIIKDVGVWNRKKKSYELIELDILQGMLAGYMIKPAIGDLEGSIIDISQIKEKRFLEEDKTTLSRILGNVNDNLNTVLDLQSTFKIELAEGVYYVIKDFGDGNYLSVNEFGAVFIMLHDPYKVEKIFENKDLFFSAIESRSFDIKKFYESQFL